MDFRTRVDNQIYGVRATALIVKDESIFLMKQGELYKTIGGAVEVGETTEDAAIREIREELGIAVKIVDLAFIVENQFTVADVHFHNIEFHYLVEALDELPEAMVEGEHSYPCQWVAFDKLASLDLRPAFLKTELPSWSGNLKHIVNKNGE